MLLFPSYFRPPRAHGAPDSRGHRTLILALNQLYADGQMMMLYGFFEPRNSSALFTNRLSTSTMLPRIICDPKSGRPLNKLCHNSLGVVELRCAFIYWKQRGGLRMIYTSGRSFPVFLSICAIQLSNAVGLVQRMHQLNFMIHLTRCSQPESAIETWKF